ncbi:ABC transporter permease [Nonomuraea cavernae]|uniref:Glycine/betaine ABC transporter permease n=1 Tax=Nonomuraea cavernae TaxID=2045107 RepID=A0A918DLM4_9ACTN|nr:ABC transporter permease subunit [Nonomuraea cavernae]MCA2188183.1 ABC transporter permease subunit [Nonomuraea cavernae]GGO74070.1 glycine/betaine ABC transporter permease [Nonomuraea cavernae]
MSATAVGTRSGLRVPGWAAPAGIAVLFVAGYLVFRGAGTLPHDDDAPQFLAITDLREWVDDNKNASPVFLYFINYIRLFVGAIFVALQSALHGLGWPGLIGLMAGLGWLAGGWRIGLLGAAGFASFGVLGVWESSVDTLALVGTAVLLSLVIGLPLGVWAGRSPRLRRALNPVLDIMQIMPTFAYLAPMVLFFQIGAPAGAIATMIYAIPPAIRITALAIEQVSPVAVEASASLGATSWQTLRKVHLPLARSTMTLAVNQTIMMALSMVVIANLISAPGLGSDIIRGLSRQNVGIMLPAGLAIVVMAVVLDRTTMAAAHRRAHERTARWRWPVAAGLVAGGVALTYALPPAFPGQWVLPMGGPVNDAVRWAEVNWYDATEAIKNVTSEALLNPLQGLLTSAPWWLVAAAVLLLAWWSSGIRPALTALGCLLAIALLGLWEHSMVTLTMVVVAVLAVLVIGLVLGVAAARSARYSAVQRPLLDAAQTMPSFVYLLPALALFGPTKFTAIFASVIYAAPPVIRLVEQGIRAVPHPVVEAALSAGSTPGQLLRKVQLPMARQAILLAANQGIVLTLAMVVLGALVGGGALGYDVVSGFSQRTDFGMGFAAGVAIVLLGIMLDRITQGADRRSSPHQRNSV